MFSSNPFLKVIALVSLVLLLSIAALADTVRLKDGSIIKGRIVSFSGGKFVMVIGQGDRQREMTFYADEIESIEFDGGGSALPISVGQTGGQNTPDDQSTAGDQNSANDQTIADGQPAPPKKKPAFTQTTQGNETIITVGSSRNDDTSQPPSANNEVVDPNAVALDPADDSANNDTAADNTSAGGDQPVANTPVGGPPVLKGDPTKPRPVQIKVSVLADDTANGWTNAGWVVKKGQKIRIISNGRISLGNGRSTGPGGIATLPDANKLIGDKPTGGLIAVIGDDNNDFIFIGESREFIAKRDGALFLGVNEGNLSDNSGTFDVIVEIEPGN